MALTQTPDAALGVAAPDFSLPGIDGAVHSTASCRGPSGLLVMFICNHCPYVRALRERLVDDCRELHALGIGVVAINPNDPLQSPDDDLGHMQLQAREWGFCFPYLQDLRQDVARSFGAVCTPDFFGFDRDLRLAYRGRLDDGTPSRLPGSHRELVEAMTEIAECGRSLRAQQPSLGCSIKWRHSDAA
jgi:peroxiredoxin